MDKGKGANLLRVGEKIVLFFAVTIITYLNETRGSKNIFACVKNGKFSKLQLLFTFKK